MADTAKDTKIKLQQASESTCETIRDATYNLESIADSLNSDEPQQQTELLWSQLLALKTNVEEIEAQLVDCGVGD